MEEVQNGRNPARFRWILSVVLLLFFLLLLFAVYIRSPYAKVRSIRIQGATGISSSMLLSDAGVTVGENILSVSGQVVQSRLLADFPILKQVMIKKGFLSQSIVLEIEQKQVAGILEVGGSLYRILTDGTVLDRDPEAIGVNRPIITTTTPLHVALGRKINDPSLLLLCRQLTDVSASQLVLFSEFHLEPWQGKTAILAFTKDGFEVRMPVSNLGKSLQLFQSIYKKLIQYHMKPGLVDLFSSKAGVYTPYTQS